MFVHLGSYVRSALMIAIDRVSGVCSPGVLCREFVDDSY